jgi:hypothetical protein
MNKLNFLTEGFKRVMANIFIFVISSVLANTDEFKNIICESIDDKLEKMKNNIYKRIDGLREDIDSDMRVVYRDIQDIQTKSRT